MKNENDNRQREREVENKWCKNCNMRIESKQGKEETKTQYKHYVMNANPTSYYGPVWVRFCADDLKVDCFVVKAINLMVSIFEEPKADRNEGGTISFQCSED